MAKFDEWPKWVDEYSFRTPRFTFACSVTDYSGKTGSSEVSLLKDKSFLELYASKILNHEPRKILEIGFFQGGMPLFLADMVEPEKILGVDRNEPSDQLLDLIRRKDLSSTIELIGGVDQSDTERLRSIVDERFDTEPLDLIIDDCSHYYAQTKACFESLFGYLRPGGKYIIEDWGWTHWPGAPWQTNDSPFAGMDSTTNLILELVMALGSSDKTIASIDVASWACVIVTRGHDLPHKAPINLRAMTNLAGGRQAHLIAP